ncbi:MAG: class I SAM-dependent methyltransferase [Burkholderiales bacterium]
MTDPALISHCPVGCASTLTPMDIVRPEGALLRCSACGQLVSQIGAAAYARSMQAFDAADFNRPDPRAAERRQRVARKRLARIAQLLGRGPAGATLVDVGCSRGDFVAAASAFGFTAEGVEPAPHIAEAARAAGRDVKTGLLDDQRYPDARFDAVTLFEVIEHLAQPLPLLTEIRRILKPGGVLLVSTGNGASWTARALKGRWDYFSIEKDAGHVSFYNPRSIALAAERAGLTAARIETARVRLAEKDQVAAPLYVAAKIGGELANPLARVLGRGHDLLAYLRKS